MILSPTRLNIYILYFRSIAFMRTSHTVDDILVRADYITYYDCDILLQCVWQSDGIFVVKKKK